MNGQDQDLDVSIGSQEVDDESNPFELCAWLCDRLAFHHQVKDMAQSITIDLSQLDGCSPRHIAAMCIYIALHLLNRQGHDIADDVARLTLMSESEEHIRSTWRSIYPDRMALIQPAILPDLAQHHMDAILEFLPVPNLDNAITNSEGEHRMTDLGEIPDEERVGILQQLSEALEDAELLDHVGYISEKLIDAMYLMAFTAQLDIFCKRSCEAVSAYMACHLMGVAIPYSEIARLYHTSERAFCQMYAQVYTRRINLVSPQLTQTMGSYDLDRVLDALLPLNWPSTHRW